MTTTLPPSGDTPAELAEHLASGARLVEAFHLMPGVARAMREAARLLRKPCTCHPDDNPPVPCPQKFALSECKAAAPVAAPEPTQTNKQAWWAGYRAGKGLPPDTPRQDAVAAPAIATLQSTVANQSDAVANPAAPAPDDARDAARYRHIRTRGKAFCVTMNIGHDWTIPDADELDAAIDAAMRDQP